jgi:uncharacterized LabA/DUF88 family protein
MPGAPEKYRVIAYIDGYNLYHGLRDADWRRFLWLDLSSLALSLLRGNQGLSLTKYFTTRISGPETKRKRQSTYLEALEAHCGSAVQMFFGQYQSEPWTCERCKHVTRISHEKKTDVNIAVEMMTDAYGDRFDTALLISADSDLVPVIQAIRRIHDKQILVAFPPSRFSAELKTVASACVTIGRAKISGSQLPERVLKAGAIRLERPEKWKPSPPTDFGQKLTSALRSAESNPEDEPA